MASSPVTWATDEVLLVRSANEIFAIAAHCSHYHGPLAEGLVVEGSIRCPWHHACFDLRSGEAVRAPALSPLDCWLVEQKDGRIFVREKREQPQPKPRGKAPADAPDKIVIVGGGAAGFAAAEMLRRREFSRQHRHAEQRRRGTGRPAEPVEGLSGRQCSRRLDAAASGQLLQRNRHRIAPRHRGHRHRHQGAPCRHRRRRQSGLRSASAGHRRGACALADSGRRPASMFILCVRSPIAAPSSTRPKKRAARS